MLTQEKVKHYLDYVDGKLIWKNPLGTNVKPGDVAGCPNSKGYLQIRIEGKRYLAHRLVWLWHEGYFPEHGLDHRDQDKTNNRRENLREVGQQCNTRNCGNPKANTSGVKGVSFSKATQKWVARIDIFYKTKYVGIHHDFTEAVAHRLAAEQCVGWEGCDSISPAFVYMQSFLRSKE